MVVKYKPHYNICSHFMAELLKIDYCYFILVLKKMKHRVVEHMSSGTADALGLSRAILCNGMVCCINASILVHCLQPHDYHMQLLC